MSFPTHLVYKESGCSWLGKVPRHWYLHKLKHVADIVGGGTPSREKREYWNGDIPWVSPKDMKTERISSAEECITELGLKNSTTSLQDVGRVLMVIRSGILQHTLPVAINVVPVALNQDMKSFSFDESKCLPEFFLRWVQGLNDDLLLAWANEGATVESINQTLLQNSILPLPDVAEQRAISSFLDKETSKIDGLVSEQRRLIELLKEKRQAVISHAVTKGLNPNAPMKPSGIQWLGEVPEHWLLSRMKHLVIAERGIQMGPFGGMLKELEESPTPFKLYGQQNTINDDFGVGSRWLNEARFNALREYELLPRDVVLTRKGASIGHCRLVPENIQTGIIDSDTIRVRLNLNLISVDFAVLLMHEGYIEKEILYKQKGSVLPGLNSTTIANLRIGLPPIKEQGEIVKFVREQLDMFSQLQAEAERAIELLQERRTALISAAVTGKIDVFGFASKGKA
jgi:type I restriction enzyme S subunit